MNFLKKLICLFYFVFQHLETNEELENSQKAKKATKNIGLMALIFIMLHLAFYIIWYHFMADQDSYHSFWDWRTLTEPFRCAFKIKHGYGGNVNLGTYALTNPMPVLSLIPGIYVLHKTISNKVNICLLVMGRTIFKVRCSIVRSQKQGVRVRLP